MDYKKLLEKLEKNPERTIDHALRIGASAFVMFFVIVFAFNLFRPTVRAAASESDIESNISQVEEFQKVEVKTVEAAVKKIETARKSNSAAGLKVIFRRKFADSAILGDSLTEGLVVYGWLPESIVYSDIGGSIIYADSKFKKAASTLPEEAFFAYGMNDMGNYNGDADAFVEKYKKLLSSFLKKSPDTDINVCSITTPTKAAMKGNKSIRNYAKFNKALKKMCKEEGYNYIDVSDILPKHKKLYAGDGIHASAEYYPYWMKRVCDKAGL